jgi:diguanylate cyclase (GGDEF)-like protein
LFAADVLLNCVDDAIVVIGADFSMMFMNDAALRSFSSESTPSVDSNSLDLVHPDDLSFVVSEIVAVMDVPAGRRVFEFRVFAEEGVRPLEATVTNHLDTPGIGGIVACFRNRTGEVAQELRNVELTTALELASDVVVLLDADGSLLYANPAARSLVHVDSARHVWPFRATLDERFQRLALPDARRLGKWIGDVDFADELGATRTLSLVITVIARPGGQEHVLITGRDETERRAAERRTELRADSDPLTGLANRTSFMRTLQRALDRGASSSLMFVDLDRFKVINDTLGHQYGDELLIVATSRLRMVMGFDDVLGRLGGDEFVLLLTDDDNDQVALRNRTEALAKVCHAALAEPVTLGDETVYMSASVGIAYASPGDTDPGQLLRHADLAMFSAKTNGRNRTAEFSDDLEAAAASKMRTHTALHHALANDEFEVLYQPIVSGDGDTLSGFEALVRWRHPDGSLRVPADFLQIAAQSDLITEIDTLVLRRACAQLAEWTNGRSHLDHITMSVNVSTRQLRRPDLVQVVAAALAGAGLAPHRLMLEVNENSLMDDIDHAIGSLDALRDLGVSIAFDDFGTGNCSLAYLRLFAAQVLKIDRRFIGNASRPDGDADVQIIKAISQLATTFGMTTIAEGVETDEQRRIAAAAGCDLMQGYLFDRPLMTADAAARLFRA